MSSNVSLCPHGGRIVVRWAIAVVSLSIVLFARQSVALEPPRSNDTSAAAVAAADAQKEREQRFKKTLTEAVFEGSFWITGAGGLDDRGALSGPNSERYTIVSAEKGLEDNWVISARIEYGGKDVTVPVPVRVVWAEDTAIITINEMPIPLIGSYSARVMIHFGFYGGVWYSKARNYGGVMSGRIIKKAAKKKPTEPTKKATPKG